MSEERASAASIPPQPRWAGILGTALLGAWFLYLLLAPTTGFFWIESWHNEQRAVEVVLLAAGAVCFCCLLLDSAFRDRLPRVSWIVFAVFALGILSASQARYREAAFAEVSLHALLLVLVLIAAERFTSAPATGIRLLRLGALILMATYVAGVAVHYAAAVSLPQPIDVYVLLLGYSNPRFPSALHALLVPLVLGLAMDADERRFLRFAAVAAVVAILSINFALGTRAIWASYAAALVLLWCFLGGRIIWPLARVFILSAVAGALLYLVVFKLLPDWLGVGSILNERSLDQLAWGSNRHLLYRSSWEAILSAPLFGIGPMQFAAIPGVWAAHPHNWILQIASEWGLIAAALAIFGIQRSFRRRVAELRTMCADAAVCTTILCACVVALLYGLVDGNLVMPVSQAAAALVFGALLGTRTSTPPLPTARRARMRIAEGLLAAAAVLTASAQLCLFSIRTERQAIAKEDVQRIYPSRALWPRYWSDGFLPMSN